MATWTTGNSLVREATVALVAATMLLAPLSMLPASATEPRTVELACPRGEVPVPSFEDIGPPHEGAVACLNGYGIAQGRSADRFVPNSPVTRAQFATFVHGVLVEAGVAPTSDGSGFDDVPESYVHAEAIVSLASATPPVVRGHDDGTFRPTDPITRQQAASITHRALQVADAGPPESDTECRFSDRSEISPAHRDAVHRLCEHGVATGRADGSFQPQGSILRGQAASFVARGLDVLVSVGGVEPPFPIRVEVLAEGLDAPWEVVEREDGRLLVTERDNGRILELRDDGGTRVAHTFSDVQAPVSTGLLGLAAEPGGDRFYAYYSSTAGDNRIVRFVPGGPEKVILSGIPMGDFHNGGRIAFGPDGYLYVTTGDVTPNDSSSTSYHEQRLPVGDPESLAGKILRLEADGGVPADNPFGNEVYAKGFRNPLGLGFDAAGQVWATEMGDRDDDEVNLIQPGAHYGWPHVTGADTGDGRYVPAVFVRQPPVASWSGMAVADQDLGFADEGDLLVGALRGQRLWRLVPDGSRIVQAESLLVDQIGRIRQVVPDREGGLYVLTDNASRGIGIFNGDAVLRLTAR